MFHKSSLKHNVEAFDNPFHIILFHQSGLFLCKHSSIQTTLTQQFERASELHLQTIQTPPGHGNQKSVSIAPSNNWNKHLDIWQLNKLLNCSFKLIKLSNLVKVQQDQNSHNDEGKPSLSISKSQRHLFPLTAKLYFMFLIRLLYHTNSQSTISCYR